MLYRVEGIVIRSFDYGEGNKIITIYTRTHGKASVMVKGAKKLKSRHSAITQLFTYGEFVYYQGGQMGSLNQGEIIQPHQKLREDLHLSAYSAYLVEMVDRMTGEQEGSEFLFEQLQTALSLLEEGKEPQVVLRIFEMKMLGLSGVMPVLHECVSCGAVEPPFALSAAMGGLLCTRCQRRDVRAMIVGEATVKLLRVFQQMDLRRLGKVEIKDQTKAELKQFMRSFMNTHVDISFRSQKFMDQMDKHNI